MGFGAESGRVLPDPREGFGSATPSRDGSDPSTEEWGYTWTLEEEEAKKT